MTFAESFDRLSGYLVSQDFKGYEYDDLLASPFVNAVAGRGLYPRIAAVQAAKRFPFDIRRLVGVPKLHSTKAWGFIIKGYLYHYLATGDDRYLPLARRGLRWLQENTSRGYSGACWGNDFDFASRSGFMPKGLPTIVWTSHIQAAFALAHEVFGDSEYRDVVVSAAEFIERDLERMPDSTGLCLAYAPGIKHPVHNSNLLGVVALLRGWRHSNRHSYLELARQSINWSVAKINPDGSWFYGTLPMLHWIDNYHTGYVLDCLCEAQDIAGGAFVPSTVIARTYEFWRDHLFEADGRPKFYHDRVHPTDIQATAQAIESFAKYSRRDPNALAHAVKVATWALAHMQKANGAYRYRIYKHWTNQLEAIHWGQGTMLSALGHVLFHQQHSTSTRQQHAYAN
jgi:hypothetical protein